jgi:peptide/nickel transport system substrate-binding protein
MPELADAWEVSDGGKTITFHLHKGVKWHDGAPFSSADVKYTIERIMTPPQGMVSPRGPVFNALIERVEAPDPDTVVVYGKGPSALLLPLFASGHNMIIPKHIVEPDPVNALKTRVIGTGPFRLKEPPTTSLWKYERNPDYFKKISLSRRDRDPPHHRPQAMVAALLSKRVYWSDVFAHANMDRDLAKSTVQQNSNLIHSANPGLVVSHLTLQKPPLDDLRVRQSLSEAVRREAISELGNQAGAVGTGVYPWAPGLCPKIAQLIGYGPDMAQRLAHAKELLAAYEKEKGKIDWSKIKLQCATTIKFSARTPRWCSSCSRRSTSTRPRPDALLAAPRQRGLRELLALYSGAAID